MGSMDLLGDKMKDITQEEVSKLTRAMKDKQFQAHMDEYCKEISDPAHRKEYLQYLDQLEAKGEMPDGQQLLRSEPGCCVKTMVSFKNGQYQKCFINIVHSDRLEDMSEGADEKDGRSVHLPYSLSPPRVERDNKGENCMTCDFAVSTWSFGQALQRPQILKMMVDTAADGLGSKYLKGFEEVKKDFKVMRRIRCRGPGGVPLPMSVRGELLKKGKKAAPEPRKDGPSAVTPSELREMRKEATKKQEDFRKREAGESDDIPRPPPAVEESEQQQSNRIRVPKHKLVHVGTYELCDFMEATHRHNMLAPNFSLPRLLRLVVEVPTVKRSSDISLDVTSCNVVIEVPDKYYLDLPLSYEIDETHGDAKFDKVKQVLTLELPVKPKMPDPERMALFGGAGSGAEDDDDGGISEGHASSEEELPPLEESSSSPQVFEPPARAEELAPPNATRTAEARHVDETVGEPVPEEELPSFMASDSFTGKRPGYFFGTGDKGLGYYRDLRQPRPRRKRQEDQDEGEQISVEPHQEEHAVEATTVEEPLIVEVLDDEEEKMSDPTASPPHRVLPDAVQQYVDAISRLSSSVPAADIDETKGYREPQLDWHQTRQNLLLLVDIPINHEVSGLQFSVAGRRLVLTFCSRPCRGGGSAAKELLYWQRNRVRQALCRAVDPRQWHAELPSEGSSQLVLVLRKADEGEMWLEAFDSAATAEPWEPAIVASTTNAQAATGDSSVAVMDKASSAVCVSPTTPPTALAPEADAVAEDSAELDIAAPAVHGTDNQSPGSTNAAVSANPAAAAAAAQSASVMGQAVLLRSRLMYQLL